MATMNCIFAAQKNVRNSMKCPGFKHAFVLAVNNLSNVEMILFSS
jgi:hypothetical protein